VRYIIYTITLLFLSGCYGHQKERFFPYRLPDAIVNQPYATTLYNFAGYIKDRDINLQVFPENNTFKMISLNANESYDTVKFFGIPTKVGQYKIQISGFGYAYPPYNFDHTYVLNVLDQSSVCNYHGIIYNNPTEKSKLENVIKVKNLPKAIVGKKYHQQIILIPINIKEDDLYKKDIQLVIYPEDSGLKIRPISGNLYNTVELYGIPKNIGNIEIVFKRYKKNNPINTYNLKSYNLPVIPDQSSCR